MATPIRTSSVAILKRIRDGMNPTSRALLALVRVCLLLTGAVILFSKRKTSGSLLQIAGAGCLLVVVLTHVCEAGHLFPSVHWGEVRSVGHYLDLSVRDILNQIVSQHCNGAWVVQQPPWTMGKDLGYGLWKVLEYDRTDAEYSRELRVRGLGLQNR